MYNCTAVRTAAVPLREYVHARLVGVSYWDFHVFMIPGKNGDQASRPREHLSSLPARRVDCGARSFAKDTEGGRVERAWLGRAAAEGPVALGRARHRGSFEDPKRHDVDKRNNK